MKKTILALLIIGLAFTGCAQRKIAKVGEPEAAEEATAAAEEVTATPVEQTAAVQTEEVAEKFVEEQAGIKLEDIFFDYDRYEIRKDAMPVLDGLASWLLKNPQGVLVEGHCDERGTNEYNLALGDRRATAAKNYLRAAGVPQKRINTASFGEERPLCKEQTEGCWAKNRRAHFAVVGTAE